MDGPRDVILSEVSQTQKDKYHMLSLIWGIDKCTYLQNRNKSHRCRKQTYAHQGGMGGRDNLGDWDWHIDTTIRKTRQRIRTYCIAQATLLSTL